MDATYRHAERPARGTGLKRGREPVSKFVSEHERDEGYSGTRTTYHKEKEHWSIAPISDLGVRVEREYATRSRYGFGSLIEHS